MMNRNENVSVKDQLSLENQMYWNHNLDSISDFTMTLRPQFRDFYFFEVDLTSLCGQRPVWLRKSEVCDFVMKYGKMLGLNLRTIRTYLVPAFFDDDWDVYVLHQGEYLKYYRLNDDDEFEEIE